MTLFGRKAGQRGTGTVRDYAGLIRFELYKALIVNRCLLLLICIFALKAAVVIFLPELKDPRIRYTQFQFDRLLAEVHGETDEDKERYLERLFALYIDTMERYGEMETARRSGAISDAEWREYAELHMEAETRLNAVTMLREKKLDFDELRPYPGAPPAYFYEYGWHSVFTYLSMPDPFLLAAGLVAGLVFICPDIASGMTRILYTKRNGRFRLFTAKLAGLMLLLCVAGGANIALELRAAALRFDLREGEWMLYSLRMFADAPVALTLCAGLARVAAIRAAGLLLTGLFALSLGYLMRGFIRASAVALAAILVPAALPLDRGFTHVGWLSGVDLLTRHAGRTAGGALLPPLIVLAGAGAALLGLGYRAGLRVHSRDEE